MPAVALNADRRIYRGSASAFAYGRPGMWACAQVLDGVATARDAGGALVDAAIGKT